MITTLKTSPAGKKIGSFSLVEMMVAMAIATMMALLFSQMVETIGRTIRFSRYRVEATMQANFVFERIRKDLSLMPRRMDIGCHMDSAALEDNTDFLRLISQAKGPKGDRNASLVGYKISPNKRGYLNLYRGVHGYNWSDIEFMELDAEGQPQNLLELPESLDLRQDEYEVLAPAVLRVALAFQYKNNGLISNDPPLYYLGTNSAVRQSLQLTNLASVIVGIVVMDAGKQQMLTPQQNRMLAARFTEVPSGITPLAHWNTNLEYRFKELSKGIPKEAAQSIRVFQRFYAME